MKEGPHELAAHVLEAELEVGVLVDGVVSALEGQGADGIALAGVTSSGPITRGE